MIDTVSGQVVEEIDYDEFGNVLKDTNPGFQPFGFAGGLYDQDTGLLHFGARDYDPQTRRWMERDPILFRGGGSNLYEYVVDDPVNMVDPLGLWTLQFGFSVNLQFGPIALNFAAGIAMDGFGNIGLYHAYGGGLGAGALASGGITGAFSNALTICDLRGKFQNGSLGGGWGPDATGDYFVGTSPHGLVEGGGLTIGEGLGGGGSSTVTNTVVTPILRF